MTDAVDIIDQPATVVEKLPVLRQAAELTAVPTIAELEERLAKAKEYLTTALVPAKLDGPWAQRHDGDYGKLPGCGDKPVLFKSGAEKLARLFGMEVARLERTMFERIDVSPELTETPVPGFMVAYACDIKGSDGRVWGTAEAFTSHDENTFHEFGYQGTGSSRRKSEFRGLAPLNTLAARAQKRAYVRAVVQALGLTSLVSTHEMGSSSDVIDETQRGLVVALYNTTLPSAAERAMKQATKIKGNQWENFLGSGVDTVGDARQWNEKQRAAVFMRLNSGMVQPDEVADLVDEVSA